MFELIINKQDKKFISSLPPKHRKQIANALFQLMENPLPENSKQLIGYHPFRRIPVGEYRIIYKIFDVEKQIRVILIGKRNDDEIYKKLKRL